MLENWLRPINQEQFRDLNLAKNQLGSKITIYEEAFPDLSKIKVGIIGVGEANADAVRRELYQMSCPFRRLKIADLGNVRKQEPTFIIQLVKELVDSKIIPVLISGDTFHIKTQYQAHQTFQELVNLTLIDENIPVHPKENDERYYLNDIIRKTDSALFNLSTIGSQGHFIEDNVFSYLEDQHFECIRLGKAKEDLSELEPLIRDADLMCFNLAALKLLEAPAVHAATPSGFFCEEACQITRYAGMSDKLASVGFYGFQPELDRYHATAKVIAQLIWYFLDGVYHRKGDFPVSTQGLTEYIVDFKTQEYQITFWNSSKSNRWWMQIPAKTNRKMRRHRLIPCSYQDYLSACEEELPERLLKANRRFL